MWDVYLGGLSDKSWREMFKKTISADIKIFDPLVENFNKMDDAAKANEAARELIAMEENCALVVFYLNSSWNGQSCMLELGDTVGRGKQVMVCLDGKVRGSQKIRRYCEFHGIPVVQSIEELVVAVEEYLAELAMCVEDVSLYNKK